MVHHQIVLSLEESIAYKKLLELAGSDSLVDYIEKSETQVLEHSRLMQSIPDYISISTLLNRAVHPLRLEPFNPKKVTRDPVTRVLSYLHYLLDNPEELGTFEKLNQDVFYYKYYKPNTT